MYATFTWQNNLNIHSRIQPCQVLHLTFYLEFGFFWSDNSQAARRSLPCVVTFYTTVIGPERRG